MTTRGTAVSLIRLERETVKARPLTCLSLAVWSGLNTVIALKRALAAIKEFGAEAIIVSLGLDTHIDDPVQEKATAGMRLTLEDYFDMGKLLAGAEVRLCFVQEGGYQVHVAGALVAQVLKGVQVEFERQESG